MDHEGTKTEYTFVEAVRLLHNLLTFDVMMNNKSDEFKDHISKTDFSNI